MEITQLKMDCGSKVILSETDVHHWFQANKLRFVVDKMTIGQVSVAYRCDSINDPYSYFVYDNRYITATTESPEINISLAAIQQCCSTHGDGTSEQLVWRLASQLFLPRSGAASGPKVLIPMCEWMHSTPSLVINNSQCATTLIPSQGWHPVDQWLRHEYPT
jgi:hypothetical protein